MDLAAYISTVTGMVTAFLGGLYFITSQIGGRIDRLEVKVDRLDDSVAEMGSRITALEHRGKE